jgi:tripartite-type tricarboxylate transporter receptor subunit TctC
MRYRGTAWPAHLCGMFGAARVGSAPDVVARIVAERLAAMWGQGVAVDNRLAGGIPGMSMLAALTK